MVDAGAVVNTPDNQMKEARPNTAGEAPKIVPKAKPVPPAKPKAPVVNEKEALALINKHTCSACHKVNERAVGPAYAEIAKRKYSTAKIVALVHSPKPENWPGYTPMAPMTHVPKKDIEKIAVWINSLRK